MKETLKLALDKKADNARELGLDYEPENTLHWHALNYRTAPTQNAQAMFEALEKFVAQPEQKPFAWYAIEHGEADIEWNSQRPIYEGNWKPLYRTPPQRTDQEQQIETLKRCLLQMQEAAKDLVEQAKSLFPPQRTWVGLNDDDKKQIAKAANYNWEMTTGEYAERIGRLTEEKLKELNT